MSYVKRNTQVIRSFTAQGRRRLANNRKKGCEVRLAGKTLAREPPPNHFWSAKLAVMGRQGVAVFSRSLRYRNKTVTLPDRSAFTFLVGEEKGVDIRIALDTIRMAHRGEYDVAVILSQDQDFSEVADEIRVIAQERDRWIKIACAFPLSPTSRNRRIPISRAMYDGCLDHRDYRPA